MKDEVLFGSFRYICVCEVTRQAFLSQRPQSVMQAQSSLVGFGTSVRGKCGGLGKSQMQSSGFAY